MIVTVRGGKVYDFALCVASIILYSEHTELELLAPAAKCNELWSKAGTFDVRVRFSKATTLCGLRSCDRVRAHKYFHAQWVNYRPGGRSLAPAGVCFVVGARRRKAKTNRADRPRLSRRFRVTSPRASHYSSRWQLIGVTHFCSCAY